MNVYGKTENFAEMDKKEAGQIADMIRKNMATYKDSLAPVDNDVMAQIEKLTDLHKNGILTDEEYQTKKFELLAKI